MTIKEVEARSGMNRANIRFYEMEGLLHPRRQDNGYRDYSEEDVEVLQKIRLLRSLGISLDEIRDAEHDRISLYRILGNQIEILEQTREETDRAENICRMMQQDMVTFGSLQPEKYAGMQAEKEMPSLICEETADTVWYIGPWRRYFARMFDLFLISAAGVTLLSVFFHINVANFSQTGMILWGIAAGIVMIVLEPAILHLFGTTPGKFLLGLSLEEDGEKPSIKKAGCWTRGAVLRGMGLGIPVLELILLIMSFLRGCRYEEMPWECLTYRQKPKNPGRVICYIFMSALLVLVMVLNFHYVLMPPNRGELTVEEFAENYNRLHKVYGVEDNLYLTDEGQFMYKSEQDPVYGVFEFDLDGQWNYGISYEMDGEKIREITVVETGKDIFASNLYSDRMLLLMMSFAGAGQDMGIFYNRTALADLLEQNIINGQNRMRLGETDFFWELEMDNMEKEGTMLFIKDDGQDSECVITYTFRLIKKI